MFFWGWRVREKTKKRGRLRNSYPPGEEGAVKPRSGHEKKKTSPKKITTISPPLGGSRYRLTALGERFWLTITKGRRLYYQKKGGSVSYEDRTWTRVAVAKKRETKPSLSSIYGGAKCMERLPKWEETVKNGTRRSKFSAPVTKDRNIVKWGGERKGKKRVTSSTTLERKRRGKLAITDNRSGGGVLSSKKRPKWGR